LRAFEKLLGEGVSELEIPVFIGWAATLPSFTFVGVAALLNWSKMNFVCLVEMGCELRNKFRAEERSSAALGEWVVVKSEDVLRSFGAWPPLKPCQGAGSVMPFKGHQHSPL
jgi:hypothetical protein